MQEIKRIGVLSTAKIFGLFGLLIGILSVVLSKIVYSINPQVAVTYGLDPSAMTISAMLIGIVFATIIYFLGGLIGAALYNLFVKWVGGIKIDIGAATSKK